MEETCHVNTNVVEIITLKTCKGNINTMHSMFGIIQIHKVQLHKNGSYDNFMDNLWHTLCELLESYYGMRKGIDVCFNEYAHYKLQTKKEP